MAKKETVYEELLKEYLSIREEAKRKSSNANARIAAAREQIEKDNALIEKAKSTEDIDKYAELVADVTKNEEIIKFFNGVIETARNEGINLTRCKEMCASADVEIEAIKEEYNKAFAAALKPLIELSNETYIKITVLENAKAKIKKNLGNDNTKKMQPRLFGLSLMSKFDEIMQDADYQAKADKLNLIKGMAGPSYNNWKSPADSTILKEDAKWI